MVFQVDDILRDARVCMDLNGISDALLADGDPDTLTVNEIIRSHIVEAVRQVHLLAPFHLLSQSFSFAYNDIFWDVPLDSIVSGWILLPVNFLRLVVFQMSDWDRPVYIPISADDPLYARQRCRTPGLRGCPQRPVCAISVRPAGKALEFFSCKSSDATVASAIFIPEPRIDRSNGVFISRRCYRPVVNLLAGLSLCSLGEADRGNILIELSKQLLS